MSNETFFRYDDAGEPALAGWRVVGRTGDIHELSCDWVAATAGLYTLLFKPARWENRVRLLEPSGALRLGIRDGHFTARLDGRELRPKLGPRGATAEFTLEQSGTLELHWG